MKFAGNTNKEKAKSEEQPFKVTVSYRLNTTNNRLVHSPHTILFIY